MIRHLLYGIKAEERLGLNSTSNQLIFLVNVLNRYLSDAATYGTQLWATTANENATGGNFVS